MKRFLQFSLIVCGLGASGVSHAGPSYRSWTLFLHPRSGYELPVPPGVSAVGEPEAASEASFVSRDGAFVMSAWGGWSPQSPAAVLESRWRLAHRPGRGINYERRAGSWFVVSGTDSEGIEYYEKFVMRGNHVATFRLAYPRARLREFEPWVEEIENGFRIVPLRADGPPGATARAASGTTRERERSPVQHGGAAERPAVGPPIVSATPDRPSAKSREVAKSMTKIDVTPPPKKKPNPTVAQASDSTMSEAATPPAVSDPVKPEKPPGARTEASAQDLPIGEPVAGRPGFVYSPFTANKSLVDAVDIRSGTRVKCPYTGKIFRVP